MGVSTQRRPSDGVCVPFHGRVGATQGIAHGGRNKPEITPRNNATNRPYSLRGLTLKNCERVYAQTRADTSLYAHAHSFASCFAILPRGDPAAVGVGAGLAVVWFVGKPAAPAGVVLLVCDLYVPAILPAFSACACRGIESKRVTTKMGIA